MSKKYLIAGLVVGMVLCLVLGGYYISMIKKAPLPKSDLPDQSPTQNQKVDIVSGDLLYKDESGFSFSYPKGIEVKDITPNDPVYYSKVSLTKGGKVLTVSVLDTKETTVEGYLKNNELLKGATLYGAVKLGEISAKQFQTDSYLSTIAIDQGILYLVEGPKDGDFWEKTQGVVVDTFIVGAPKGSSGTSGGGDNAIYEPEEVVE